MMEIDSPGIKPILFTQVYYHLQQRSYLHHRPHTPDRTHSPRHHPHNQYPDPALPLPVPSSFPGLS